MRKINIEVTVRYVIEDSSKEEIDQMDSGERAWAEQAFQVVEVKMDGQVLKKEVAPGFYEWMILSSATEDLIVTVAEK